MKNGISKGHVNYIVDLLIAVGFIVSAGTGIVLAASHSGGGFQGGRNAAYVSGFLGFSPSWWKSLHTWSSYLMAAGVLGHLLLHAKWIGCMTRSIFSRPKRKISAASCEVPA